MDKKTFFEKYNVRTHLYGRVGLIIGIIMMLGIPFVIGMILDAMPDIGAFWKGFAQVALVYVPSSIVEFLIYTPMLGAGGSYLAFITGNLINMKIPCMMNAKQITGAEAGTAESEIVSTLSIAASALTTTAVIAIGVLLLIPLQPILSSPVLQPAFDNVVPALFGALAFQYFRKGMKIVAIPLIVMTAVFILVPSLIGSVGFMIIPSGAMAIGIGYVLWKRESRREE